jgi:hypothetical protein
MAGAAFIADEDNGLMSVRSLFWLAGAMIFNSVTRLQ